MSVQVLHQQQLLHFTLPTSLSVSSLELDQQQQQQSASKSKIQTLDGLAQSPSASALNNSNNASKRIVLSRKSSSRTSVTLLKQASPDALVHLPSPRVDTTQPQLKAEPKPAAKKRTTLALIQAFSKIISETGAKEKILKLVQYMFRFFIQIGHFKFLSKLFTRLGVEQLLNPFVAQISTFRKFNKMGNWLPAAQSVAQLWSSAALAKQGSGLSTVFDADAQLMLAASKTWNAAWDDIQLLAKLSSALASSSVIAQYAFEQCTRAWLASILLSLYLEGRAYLTTEANDENGEKRKDIGLTLAKLGFDLVFCLIDLTQVRTHELVQTSMGMGSAMVALYKMAQ